MSGNSYPFSLSFLTEEVTYREKMLKTIGTIIGHLTHPRRHVFETVGHFSTTLSKKILDQNCWKFLPKKDLQDYMSYFPKFIEDVTAKEVMLGYPQVNQRLKNVLEYMGPSGEHLRQHMLIYTYKSIEEHYQTFRPENMEEVHKLCWCLELLNTGNAIMDYFLDDHDTRRNMPTLTKKEGKLAIMDLMLLRDSLPGILRKYFEQHPRFNEILKTFQKPETMVSLALELETKNYEDFTVRRCEEIAMLKTVSYVCDQPFMLATLLANKGLHMNEYVKKALRYLRLLYSMQTYSKMIFYVIGSILVYYFVKNTWKFIRIWSMMKKIGGPEASSWIFGHFDILCQPPELLYKKVGELCKTYYPAFFLRIFNVCAVILMDPEDCEVFLSTPKHTRKSEVYNIFKHWLKDGLLLSSGEKWQHRRKVLTPAFHFSLLKDFMKTFNEKTDELVTSLAVIGTDAINVVPVIQEFSLSTIIETAMGYKTQRGDENHKEYRKGVSEMEKLFNQWIVRPWLSNVFIQKLTSFPRQEAEILKVLHHYTKSIIKQRILEANENSSDKNAMDNDDIYFNKRGRRMAMLDILLEAQNVGNQIDFKGICEEVDTFTFEGHDTVSSALSFSLMMIANLPEVQNRLLEEIHSVLGEEQRHPTYEDLQNMEYLERCIKECLRLYPSVHIISRVIDEDTKLHSGLMVPKNGIVFIPIIFIHRNPDIYPDPEKFDPDRFLLDNCLQRHPFAYIPFSAGPRNCIGQRFAMLEMKVLLSAVVRKFQLIPVDTPENIELKMEAILRAKNGIRVKFIPRL